MDTSLSSVPAVASVLQTDYFRLFFSITTGQLSNFRWQGEQSSNGFINFDKFSTNVGIAIDSRNTLFNLAVPIVFCTSFCLSFCLFFCLCVCLTICLPVCLPVCLSDCCACLPVCLGVIVTTCMSTCLPVCLSSCLSVRLCLGLFDCFLICLAAYLYCSVCVGSNRSNGTSVCLPLNLK